MVNVLINEHDDPSSVCISYSANALEKGCIDENSETGLAC